MTALCSEISQMMYIFKIGEQRTNISCEIENHPKDFDDSFAFTQAPS